MSEADDLACKTALAARAVPAAAIERRSVSV